MVFAYTAANIANLESSHSPERLGPYYALVGGDKELGIKLYAWNSALSQAFYIPLQGLEVALRNALGGQLLAAYGPLWFDLNPGPALHYPLPDQLLKARTEVGKKGVANHGRIVAELNWGFWTGILAKRYEPLWRSHFRKAFNATGPLTRDQIFQPLDDLRRLRNRIAHHEPIINRNIAADYASILNLISYASPTTAQWIDDQSEIAAVIAAKP
ncbi:hypothetical protein [Rhizobium leguminosarum]|uniref:hypothetical protein n=1 Tax=Rhizobium leguminosarum TaxID=384 RepID=UPI0013B7272B|nr:hypothetical protein [Rhizobium leguminosarum]NEI67414.1 hypothetical protein [Rhizobium leguminosarum]